MMNAMLIWLSDFIQNIISNLGVYGPLLGCLLIVVESMIPILPLCLFITMNFVAFGNILGFIISWIFTLIGCNLSYFICRKFFKGIFERKLRKYAKLEKFMKLMDNITYDQLVVLVAIPFTPAYLVNIASGISKMSYKKYFWAMFLGKIFMVYFWGYVGVTFLECLKNPIYFVKIIIIMVIAYLISHFINKKFNIK
jgi:uncharacterized membrane protein YdjX (TVP38/TMEM64 family)